MADHWTYNIACRYFKNGICRKGNNCRYRHIQTTSHDSGTNETEISSNPTSTIACHFFKDGRCKFSTRCHFLHNLETSDTNACTQTNLQESSALKQLTTTTSTSVETKNTKSSIHIAEEWVKAPEFIPSSLSLVAGSSLSNNVMSNSFGTSTSASKPVSYAEIVNPTGQASDPSLEPLCPYAEARGICRKPDCIYLHGNICELCGHAALHPYNEELRKKHTDACAKQHEDDKELFFAIQRSKGKSCGICFETVIEKSLHEQRFGILPNCNHCFCLTCIRKWRQVKQFDKTIIKACPQCRVNSDFVCPSMYWVDTKEEKTKLFMAYKAALSSKNCKYFIEGCGKCPFNDKCFYRHALPNGIKKDVPPVRQRYNADGDTDFVQQLILWDFLEDRDDQWMFIEMNDTESFYSDSEGSDWSDYDIALL